jgi:hypothetical protein
VIVAGIPEMLSFAKPAYRTLAASEANLQNHLENAWVESRCDAAESTGPKAAVRTTERGCIRKIEGFGTKLREFISSGLLFP